MTRVVAYVDGFNLYHGLSDLKRRDPSAFPDKRIDLRALVTRHLLHEGEELVGVRWYSAIPAENWRDPEQKAQVQRHKAYRAALEATDVDCRISGFRKRPVVSVPTAASATRPRRKRSRMLAALSRCSRTRCSTAWTGH